VADVAENLGGFCTGEENDFELISTLKMKTRNSVGVYFGTG